jgi:organic radical activating enzyme
MEHFKLYKDTKINYPLSTDPAIRINMDNLKTIRKYLANGIWPLACQNCKNAEDNNIASMRTIWNNEIHDAPINEVINPLDIVYLDLTFSTKCNSKCMTCNVDLSDFWEEENAVHFPNSRNKIINRVSINVDAAHKLIDTFPNVRRISFIGGEPTISDEHIEFLKMLIARGTSNNIGLSYVTNLTSITDELLELWEKFRTIHLVASIDGLGKINEYIRYPFKWSKTETNLQIILELCKYKPHRYSMSLSCTHSVYNAIQAPDLFEYLYDTLKTYDDGTNTVTPLQSCGAFINRVSQPKNAMICNLSTAYREQGIKKVNNLLKKIQTDIDNGLKVNQGIVDSIKLMGVWLEEPCSMNNNNITTLINFIKTSDKFRNRNIIDYIPELMEELQKLK